MVPSGAMDGRNYYFTNYLAKKKEIKANSSARNEKWKFDNSIKFGIKTAEVVTSKQIFDNLKSSFGENTVKEIKNLSQYGSSKTWVVGFNDSHDITKLIGKEITFNNTS